MCSDEFVRLILLETRQIHAHLATLVQEHEASNAENDSPLAAQLVTYHSAAQRNKRCLLAYHNSRLALLRSVLWNKGGSLDLTLSHQLDAPSRLGAHEEQKTTLRSRLCPAELEYVRQYAELNLAYKTEFLDIADIATSLHRSGHENDVAPMRELMVSIEAYVDAKEVQTERGSINLRRGDRIRILRSEVEALILRGWVGILDE